jgi:hypothetical protein
MNSKVFSAVFERTFEIVARLLELLNLGLVES